MLAHFHQSAVPAEQPTADFFKNDPRLTVAQLQMSAQRWGIAKACSSPERLTHWPLPGMTQRGDGTFFIIARLVEGQVLAELARWPGGGEVRLYLVHAA